MIGQREQLDGVPQCVATARERRPYERKMSASLLRVAYRQARLAVSDPSHAHQLLAQQYFAGR